MFLLPLSAEVVNCVCIFEIIDRVIFVSGILRTKAMATEEDSVEQVAAARKERLKALRAAQELLNNSDEKNSGGEDKENGATEDSDET